MLKKETEPVKLVQDFAKLQQTDPSKERTLMSIGTGSLVLAHAGLLQGLAATTHPDYYTKMEIICKEAARRGDLEQTDVMEENYVVNNARFDLGEKLEENPFVLSKRPDGRRKSIARKGSNAWKESVKRRESNARRASLRLGGLRVITSGGVSASILIEYFIQLQELRNKKIFASTLDFRGNKTCSLNRTKSDLVLCRSRVAWMRVCILWQLWSRTSRLKRWRECYSTAGTKVSQSTVSTCSFKITCPSEILKEERRKFVLFYG